MDTNNTNVEAINDGKEIQNCTVSEKAGNENNSKQSQRELGPDILKSLATLFVICVHFYLNVGYYSAPLNSPKLFIMTVARWLFLICVPLFIILTGYLKLNKTVSKSHYMSLVPLFTAYIVICIHKMHVANQIFGKVYTFGYGLKNLANYQIAWYMGMYMSLMLIIPFLNKMWKGCNGRKEHNILLGSLVFVSMLYPVFLYVVPSYWQMLYPLAYYFFGTYAKVYRPKINKIILAVTAAVMVVGEAIVSYHFANGEAFNWTILGPVDSGYSTVTVAITAACVFLLLYDVDIKNKVVRKIFKSISSCSFEIYLFSSTYDTFLFYYLKRYVYTVEDFFWWIFITVPTSFVAGWISSLIYKFLYNKVSGFVVKIYKMLMEKRTVAKNEK